MTVLADENQPPVPFTQPSVGVFDLAGVGLAAELADGLHEQEHAPHAGMAMRQAAAVGVGWQSSVETHPSVGDERATFALRAEAEPFERLEHHRRERVDKSRRRRSLRVSLPPVRTLTVRSAPAGESVKSAHSLIVVCEVASPVPRIHTGFLAEVPGAALRS